MIHHDYILRLIEEFARALAQIRDHRANQRPADAAAALDQHFLELTGADRASILRLSTTELLARILRTGTAQDAQTRTLFVVALLRESSELARQSFPTDPAEAEDPDLKALRLLLGVLEQHEPPDLPRFVPTVDGLLAGLHRDRVPPDLRAQVMQYHERLGRFADAENDLFDLLDRCPPGPELLEFGAAFYRRTLALADATLTGGGLPRDEAMDGYTEFRRRAGASPV